MPSPIGELLEAFARAMRSLDTGWYLFGAQAAILHGAARLTADVDVTVNLGARPTARLVEALVAEGFAQRVSDSDDFVARTRVLPVVHVVSGMPVDVVLAGPGIEEQFLSRATSRSVEGTRVPIACAEDIIAMKILAGRPKDVDDAVAIVAAQGDGLRLPLVRETLTLLEQALGQSDLLPLLQQVLDQARR